MTTPDNIDETDTKIYTLFLYLHLAELYAPMCAIPLSKKLYLPGQSGNDERLRTRFSKVEGSKTTTHAVESLIEEKLLNVFDRKMLLCSNL